MRITQERRIFIVLGLYKPDPVLLSRQLESLAAQTHRAFEVFACCDGPLEAECRAVIDAVAGLPVRVLQFDVRVGVHANFARGLRQALAASRDSADLFAFCDQDDFWHPSKLQRETVAFGDPQTSLVHCDARLVSERGELIAPSLFSHEARSEAGSFPDLLIMNSVTGMTAVFRRDVAEAAQDFPLSGCRYILHDHWVALVAALQGDVRFIGEPLVDYTQHGQNVRGARQWRGLPGPGVPRGRGEWLRRCYRQFLWRQRAVDALRAVAGIKAPRRDTLFGRRLAALFDCDAGRAAGLVLSLAYRARGSFRQADQVYRIWIGKLLYCGRRHQRRAASKRGT